MSSDSQWLANQLQINQINQSLPWPTAKHWTYPWTTTPERSMICPLETFPISMTSWGNGSREKRREYKKAFSFSTHHDFRFNIKVFLTANLDMFLHKTEVVKTTDKQATAVCSQIKIYIFTEIPKQRNIDLHVVICNLMLSEYVDTTIPRIFLWY